jgi:hypothetical protein
VDWSTPVNREIHGRDLRGRLPGFKIHYSCGCDASDEEEKGNHYARKDYGSPDIMSVVISSFLE